MPLHVKYGYKALTFEEVSWAFLPHGHGGQSKKLVSDVLYSLVKKLWQVSGAIYRNLQLDEGQVVPDDLQRYFRAAQQLSIMQRETAVEISRSLTGAGFRHVLMKGAASAELVYEVGDRISGDIDIGLNSSCVHLAHQFLRSKGFLQSGYDSKTRRYVELADDEARQQEKGHHELCMLVRQRILDGDLLEIFERVGEFSFLLHPMILRTEQGLLYVEEIDLHHGLFPNISCGLMIERSLLAKENSVCLPGVADHFCHVLMKLYWEAARKYGKGAHQVADLYRLCLIMNDGIWSDVVDLLSRYNMLHAGYYICSRLQFIGAHVPEWAVNDLGRRAANRWDLPNDANDFGDVWDKVWWLGV